MTTHTDCRPTPGQIQTSMNRSTLGRTYPVRPQPLDADIMETLVLKANHLIDVRRAKNNLVVRPDCPDFPDALWTDILLDHYINLDRVYTRYYALDSDT